MGLWGHLCGRDPLNLKGTRKVQLKAIKIKGYSGYSHFHIERREDLSIHISLFSWDQVLKRTQEKQDFLPLSSFSKRAKEQRLSSGEKRHNHKITFNLLPEVLKIAVVVTNFLKSKENLLNYIQSPKP